MRLRTTIETVIEWVLRRSELREARARREQGGPERRSALEQVHLLLEVARRVSEPAEPLPRGSRPAVLVGLYRDAATWALRADSPGALERPLAEAWAEASPDRLLSAAGDEASLAAVRALLLEAPEGGSLGTRDAGVQLVRSFVLALVKDVQTPERRVRSVQRQRWTRLALVAAAFVAIAVAASYALRGPDLAFKRPFTQSSVYQGCGPAGCTGLMFHTDFELNPWMTIDLGRVKSVRLVQVRNRTDCCSERALPLVVELSTDNRNFTEVARREGAFFEWAAKFESRKARYVRLRSLHTTALHLEGVVVR